MTNMWIFTGNLGRDAELRKTQGGMDVLSFSVPVKSGYGERQQTQWIDCAMFGKRAEALSGYLKKGTPVTVAGEVSLQTFQKGDGSSGAKISVNVNDVTLQGRASDSQQGQSQGRSGGSDWDTPNSGNSDLDDDIPF